MKLLIMLTLVVLTLAPSRSGAQKTLSKTEQLVREVDTKLTAALLKGDVANVDAILAQDYIEITAQGLVRNKQDVMTTVRAQASAPRSISVGPEITVDETKVRVYGDTAVLFSRTTTRYQFMENLALPQTASPTATDQYRLVKVFSKLNGRWQLVASQSTATAKALNT